MKVEWILTRFVNISFHNLQVSVDVYSKADHCVVLPVAYTPWAILLYDLWLRFDED